MMGNELKRLVQEALASECGHITVDAPDCTDCVVHTVANCPYECLSDRVTAMLLTAMADCEYREEYQDSYACQEAALTALRRRK